MEATGVYWIPIYEILEARGLEVVLVNARHVKNVPGRKTDVVDCQWIQELHSLGLLRGSFRPSADIASQDWAPSMEEGGRLSSTGPRRERVLPVQVDSRRSTSKSDSRSASCRIGACVQRAQSNDRAWSTRVVRDRSVTNLRVGALGASFDLRNNAVNRVRAPVPRPRFSDVLGPFFQDVCVVLADGSLRAHLLLAGSPVGSCIPAWARRYRHRGGRPTAKIPMLGST